MARDSRPNSTSPLRRSNFLRSHLKDRPIRGLDDLRTERNEIDAALLALVADDPAKVEEMNRLLDLYTLNSVDHTRRANAAFDEKFDALRAQVDDLRKIRGNTKTPDVALTKALGRVRHLLTSGGKPSHKTIDQAISDVVLAVDRLIEATREQ